MKNILYAFLTLSLMLQSCSHLVLYQEAEYTGYDSPYPPNAMQFAYHADGSALSSSLVRIGNNILQKVKSDQNYKSYQQSAVNFEKGKNKNAVLLEKFETAVSEVGRAFSAQNSSDDHTDAISKMRGNLNKLPEYNDAEFQNCWQHIYQLSHRGILQHYMNSNAEYKSLSNTNKALVYGYILKKDLDECELLASAKVNSDKENLSGLKSNIRREISRRESILQEIEKRRKAEEEKQRQKRLAEERARQERIAREQAQQRWNDPTCSWLEDKTYGSGWKLETAYGVTSLYFDTDKQTVKQYFMPYKNNPLKKSNLVYQGRYSISDGVYNGVNCKFIDFEGTRIIAYPDRGKLRDLSGEYFHRSL